MATACAASRWRDPRDGEGLWWKIVNRNKRTIALDLKLADDLETLRRLVVDADVLIENFRPGTLERLGLRPGCVAGSEPVVGHHPSDGIRPDRPVPQPARLRHDRRVDVGPRRDHRASPDGQPLLPAIALTDEVTGVVAALRDHGGAAE